MSNKDDNRSAGAGRFPFPAPSELRGRQSVRATFRLSRQAIDALSIAAVHLGIKQKSLFDHLIEDASTLERIAREVGADITPPAARVQKTFVLSRRSLSALENVCRVFETPRDALVEYSIQRLLPVIEREKEKHRQRKSLVEKMARLSADGERILHDALSALGPDDPLTAKLHAAVSGIRSATEQTEAFVERCAMIEEF